MKKNVAGQIFYFQLVTTSFTAFVGTPAGTVSGDNGSDAAVGGTIAAVGSSGKFSYTPTQAETNFNVVGFQFTGTLAIPVTVSFETTDGPLTGASPKDGIIDAGTAQSATSTMLVLRSAAAFADNELIGGTVTITGGSAGVGQSRYITANVGSTDTITVDAWTTTPTGTITYEIFAGAPASASSPATVLLSSGTGTGQLSLTSGTVALTDASLTAAKFASNAITAAVLASDAGAEIAAAVWDLATSGHTTAATFGAQVKTLLDLIATYIDTEVAAIKAKTDNLPSDPADASDIAAAFTTLTTTINTSRYQKNAIAADIPVVMVDSTDHVTRKTGLTVTVTRSIDGGAFGSATGTAAEIANGVYQFDASAADMNGNNIVLRFTGTAADPVELHIKTYT